jgi:hypothetical protein
MLMLTSLSGAMHCAEEEYSTFRVGLSTVFLGMVLEVLEAVVLHPGSVYSRPGIARILRFIK